MSKIIYKGVHDAVEIAETGIIAENGKHTEVPDDVAAVLLAQGDDWRAAPTPKPKPKPKPEQPPATAASGETPNAPTEPSTSQDGDQS